MGIERVQTLAINVIISIAISNINKKRLFIKISGKYVPVLKRLKIT